MPKTRTVTVEINQQQRQLIERLISEGGHGSGVADAIRLGFVRFCKAHPELLRASARPGGKRRHARP